MRKPIHQAQVEALRQGLERLGWEEGRNVLIDVRFPAADAGRVRAILTELMSLAPDVLVTNTNLVTAVVQAEVRTIPIVFISVGDPVGAGFVSDEARPTGNLTGFANWRPPLGEKWLELLKEIAPQVERVLIVALATRLRVPALYPFVFYAKAGGLISYSFDPLNQFRQGAEYVDRILRGAKPADLPVQYPTKFQLVVNLTTAK